MKRMHLAVIGAGIAGVSLSAALLEMGFTITLFERSPRAGGRMSARILRGEGNVRVSCDHGAQYFTARHPGFQQVVQSWMQRGWAVPWQGRVASVVAAADASLAPAARLPLEHGVAPAVMATVPSPSTKHPPIQHLEASEPRYVGTPEMTTPVREELERLHSIAGAQFRWRPSHRLLHVRRVGRADLVATAAEQAEMASGNRLSGAPALPQETAPLRQGPGWLLDFELLGEGSAKRSLAFDGVVLAVPRPQFEVLFGAPPKGLSADRSGAAPWVTPADPSGSPAEGCDVRRGEDRNEAGTVPWPFPATWHHDWARTRMQACWALMLRYADPLSLPFDGLFCNDPRASWLCRNNSKPGRSTDECWVVHAAPAWSEAHLGADPGWIAEQLEAVLRAHGAPPAIGRELHRWRHASCEGRAPRDAYWDPDTCIGVCGDWLAGGRVEGAWLSARVLAERIGETVSVRPSGL